MKDESVENSWEFWKPIVCDKDGNVDVEQLKLELHDFSLLLERMSKLTDRLTNSHLSYPTYDVDTILELHDLEFNCSPIDSYDN